MDNSLTLRNKLKCGRLDRATEDSRAIVSKTVDRPPLNDAWYSLVDARRAETGRSSLWSKTLVRRGRGAAL